MNKSMAYQSEITGADHPLKSLLMDKGAGGLEHLFQNSQQRMIDIQTSMMELIRCHSTLRDEFGVNCLNLILIRNLQDGVVRRDQFETLIYDEQRSAQCLEWRGAAEWAAHFGYNTRIGIRVSPFDAKSDHYRQVKEFIVKRNKQYYDALLAVESIRVTLNSGARILRKQMSELLALRDEKSGLRDFDSIAVSRYAQRLIKTLPHSEGLETAISLLN